MWTTTPITIRRSFPNSKRMNGTRLSVLEVSFFFIQHLNPWIQSEEEIVFFHRIMLQVPKMKCLVSVGIFVLLLCFALTLDIWILIVFLLSKRKTTVGIYIPFSRYVSSQESTVHLLNSLSSVFFRSKIPTTFSQGGLPWRPGFTRRTQGLVFGMFAHVYHKIDPV